MKHALLCLLITANCSAHAEIALIKPMTEAECRQVLRDALDMYYDSRYCETESNEQTRQHAITAWYALGELNSRIGNEEFNRCPDLRWRGAEQDAFLRPTPNRAQRPKPPVSAHPATAPASPRSTSATSRCSKS